MSTGGENLRALHKALMLGSALFLLGAAPSAAADVTFESWSPLVQTTNKMVEVTQAKFPDIKIKSKIFNYPDYIVDLPTRAASGDMADIIGLEPGALTQQYRKFLMPLQDCAAKTWGPDWKDKLYPISVDQLRLGNPPGDENFYGLPILTQTINLWYTVPVLKDAGVAPPKNYDELLKAAKILTEKGYGPLLVGLGDGWPRRDIYMQLIHDIAPGLIYKAEVGEAKFTDKPFVDAMKWWKRFFDDGIFQPGALGLSQYPNAADLIEGGRAGMFAMGAWWQQEATRENPPPLAVGMNGFEPMKFPDLTGKGAPDDLLGGIDVMLGVSKSAKDPEAACKVVTDWVSGVGAQALINTFNDLPAWKGMAPQVYVSDHQKEVWHILTDEWLPKVKYARQLRSPAIKQAFEDGLAAVASGEETPEKAMANIQAVAEKEKK
jgi:raffinose/stachyose/melibiose transport system substrate-binding protein